MKFDKPMGIDPIINPILGYVPTPTDYLNFMGQLQSIENNINKFWPKDDSWDIYEIDDEEETKITFESIKEEKKELQEKFNINNISDEFTITMVKTK